MQSEWQCEYNRLFVAIPQLAFTKNCVLVLFCGLWDVYVVTIKCYFFVDLEERLCWSIGKSSATNESSSIIMPPQVKGRNSRNLISAKLPNQEVPFLFPSLWRKQTQRVLVILFIYLFYIFKRLFGVWAKLVPSAPTCCWCNVQACSHSTASLAQHVFPLLLLLLLHIWQFLSLSLHVCLGWQPTRGHLWRVDAAAVWWRLPAGSGQRRHPPVSVLPAGLPNHRGALGHPILQPQVHTHMYMSVCVDIHIHR